MALKWIFFDVGYTLVDESVSQQKRAEAVASRHPGITPADVLAALKAAAGSGKPLFQTAMAALGIAEEEPYPAQWDRAYPQTASVLEELSRTYRLGVIANQTPGLLKRLHAMGIGSYFDVVICSDEVGLRKPDARIFSLALRSAGCEAAAACMVGDRLDNDILPAKRLGMKTVWVRQGFCAHGRGAASASAADGNVAGLSQLTALIAGWEKAPAAGLVTRSESADKNAVQTKITCL